MNLTEIKQSSDKKLFEEIDATNDTGFLTEDLVKVARAKDGPWTEMSGDEFEAYIKQVARG